MDNRRLISGLAALVIFAVVGVIWNAAQKDERPTGEIADQIKTWAEENTPGGAAFDVSCPDPVEWKVGGTFHCIASQGRHSARVTVTMENDAGTVTWLADAGG